LRRTLHFARHARAGTTRSGYFPAAQHAPVITIGGSTRTSTVDLDEIRITE
jgi:hypothetical protein